MSLPVSYIAAMISSSEIQGSLTRLIAIVAAFIAFTAEMAFLSMQGNLYLPAQRIAGQSQMMFHGNFSGAQRLLHGCAHQFSQPAAAIEHATPISPDSQLQIPE